jgi:DNA-binding MarR family transcriptional regulator
MTVVSIDGSLAYRVYRAARLLRWDFLKIALRRGVELSPEQWFVLNKLRRQEGVSQTELGESIFADRPNMTRMLASLEEKAFIRREPDPSDARRTLVWLTTAGRGLHDLFAAGIEPERQRVFQGISSEDLAATMRVLAQLEQNLGAKP